MGKFGFSYVGLIYLLILFIPNLFWAKHKPAGYTFKNESRLLLLFERVGQVCVTCFVLIFSDFNITAFSLNTLWLIVSFALMLLYALFWVRYFRGPHTLKDFYGQFCGIPLPGATLPVAAFLLLGIYGNVFLLIVSTVILGIGHIGIHIQHLKDMRRDGAPE